MFEVRSSLWGWSGSWNDPLFFFFCLIVLPPISTTGLTAADVPVLAARVREEMLVALREMSPHASSEKPITDTNMDANRPDETKIQEVGAVEKEEEELRGSVIQEVTASAAAPVIHNVEPLRNFEPSRSSSASLASSSTSSQQWKSETSENGVETEEDEGMILVGRPN